MMPHFSRKTPATLMPALLALTSVVPLVAPSDAAAPATVAVPTVETAQIPLAFEPNLGQTGPEARFLARGEGYMLFLTADGVALRLRQPSARETCVPCAATANPLAAAVRRDAVPPAEYSVVKVRFAGANPAPVAVGEKLLPGRSRYLTAMRWQPGQPAIAPRSTEAPQYGQVRYRDVYPGIDAVFYGNGRRLEYDFVVAPGADPSAIRLRFEGASAVRQDADGRLALDTGAAPLVQHPPVLYQEVNGKRRPVAGRYVLENGEARFSVASYDRSRPLVIDPVLSYSTYLGGGGDDDARAVAVDRDGNILVGGVTESTDFPGTNGGYVGYDGFITKLNATGTGIVYSAYVVSPGLYSQDAINDIAVDADGNAFLTGRVVTPYDPDASFNTYTDVFIARLRPDGTPEFAIAVGGIGEDVGNGIALGPNKDVYVTGHTTSADYDGSPQNEGFPVFPANVYQTAKKKQGDAFVLRIDQFATVLKFSTYLGGDDALLDDEAYDIAVDAAGNAIVVGTTPSSNFPMTPSARQATYGGHLSDGYLAKISADGTQLLYSTFLGGGFNEDARSVAVDANGIAYVAGWTNSYDFRGTPGSFQPEWTIGDCDPSPTGTLPCADAFIAKVDTTKSGEASFLYATFLGGNSSDYAYGITVDADGNAYVTGQSLVLNFPEVDPVDTSSGGRDAFVAKLSPDGKSLLFCSTLGGSSDDKGEAIALDSNRNIILVGQTSSKLDWPRVKPLQDAFGGGYTDAFVAKILMGGAPPPRGDVDGNGQFTVDDVKLALRISAGLSAPGAGQVARGDLSGDGHITQADVTALARALSGK